jgi:hypothetical protein
MNDPIQEYQDFIKSDEEKDQYVDPIIMDNYQDRQEIYRIKSQIEVAASKVYYWVRQGSDALAHVALGGLIGVGFIAIVSKLAHFAI